MRLPGLKTERNSKLYRWNSRSSCSDIQLQYTSRPRLVSSATSPFSSVSQCSVNASALQGTTLPWSTSLAWTSPVLGHCWAAFSMRRSWRMSLINMNRASAVSCPAHHQNHTIRNVWIHLWGLKSQICYATMPMVSSSLYCKLQRAPVWSALTVHITPQRSMVSSEMVNDTFHHHMSVKRTEWSSSESAGNVGREEWQIGTWQDTVWTFFLLSGILQNSKLSRFFLMLFSKGRFLNSLGSLILCWVSFQDWCTGKMPSAEQQTMGSIQPDHSGIGSSHRGT